LLSCAMSSSSSVEEGHHIREICIAIRRILSQIDSESNIKRIISKYVTPTAPDKNELIIEEFDGESKTTSETLGSLTSRDKNPELLVMRGLLVVSLLYAINDIWLWVLQKGLSKGNLSKLIQSGNFREMFIASEIVAACAPTGEGRFFCDLSSKVVN